MDPDADETVPTGANGAASAERGLPSDVRGERDTGALRDRDADLLTLEGLEAEFSDLESDLAATERAAGASLDLPPPD